MGSEFKAAALLFMALVTPPQAQGSSLSRCLLAKQWLVDRAHAQIGDIRRQFGGWFEMPAAVVVEASDGPGPSVSVGRNQMRISIPSKIDIQGKAVHPKQIEPWISHEYFHGVFETTLEREGDRVNPGLREKMKSLQELRDLYKRFRQGHLRQQEIRKLRDEAVRAEDFDAELDLRDELKVILKEQEEIGSYVGTHQAEVATAHRFLGILLPYEELFADAGAILFHGDPRAIAESIPVGAVEIDPVSNARHVLSRGARDFSKRTKFERWRDQKDVHDVLAPARYALYRNFIRNPKFRNRPARILRALFDAIEAELHDRLSNPALAEMPQKEMNRRLVERLEEIADSSY